MELVDPVDCYVNNFQEALRPPPIITVSEWSDKYRKLPSKTSSEPGQWRTERTPYLKEIMDELSHMSDTQEVVFMKSAQVGGTEAGNNWIGYIVDYMPGTVMIVWPTLPDVKKNSTLRIDPLFSETPKLRGKISDGKNKDKKNTALFKDFDGGALIMTGANSSAGLRSVPARFLFLDEIDEYPANLDGQGCPIALVQARTRTFSRRKIFKVSTPTIKGFSKIEDEFDASDQRHYQVPCPHCKTKQKLNFKQLEYETIPGPKHKIVTSASYFCNSCGEEIKEFEKTWMLASGEWIKENPESEIAGFHINSLYSPLGWFSWKEIAQDWVKAQGNSEKLTTFYNTVLGLTYEETGEKPQEDLLFQRREQYQIGTVPRGACFLTCAVDVQGDRLEAEVIAWGRNKERWSVEHKVIVGKPQEQQTWDDLDEYISTTFSHVDGFEVPIKMVGIDSGYETSRVYAFCRKYSARRVVALKGDEKTLKIVGTRTAVDVKENGKNIRRGLVLWKVGTNLAKAEIYGDLMLKEPADLTESYPPGFIHFPEYEMEYFKQLTAEEKTIKKDTRGQAKVIWVKKRERNEILDLHVYNRAVASILGIDRLKPEQFDKLLANLSVATKIEKKDTKDKSRSNKKKKRKKRESSWL